MELRSFKINILIWEQTNLGKTLMLKNASTHQTNKQFFKAGDKGEKEPISYYELAIEFNELFENVMRYGEADLLSSMNYLRM
jgi:phosphatidate phosphatase APP1